MVDPLFIITGCMIFLSPFLDVLRMSISTVHFLKLLDFGVPCLYNSFLWPLITITLSLELTHSFLIWALSKKLSSIISLFSFLFCNSMPCSGSSALDRRKPNLKKQNKLDKSENKILQAYK